MKIVKWKSISQWKPSTFTLNQVENFICEHYAAVPKEMLNQVNFTVGVRKPGIFKDQIVDEIMRWDQISQRRGLAYIRVELPRNQFLKSYANDVLQRIANRIAASNEWPIPIGDDFFIIYVMDMPSRMASIEAPMEVWLFKGDVYLADYSSDMTRYSFEQMQLLISECYDKDRQKWEELARKYSSDHPEQDSYSRERIPENVRIEVWRRDGGKCARCGSREKLEYDHIVPISKGGSNTARNIELLCEKHNREKGDRIE